METTLSIWTQYFCETGIEGALDEFAALGLTGAELSTEHGCELYARSADVAATGEAVRAYAKKKNITMTQGHLPLGFQLVTQKEDLPTLLRHIDLYEACGVKNMVLHCDKQASDTQKSGEQRFAENLRSLEVIANHIEGREICICLENIHHSPKADPEKLFSLAYAEDLIKIIEALGSRRFGICLDTGHLNLVQGNQGDFIRTAGSYLRALHIADNRGERDDHLMPFGGKIDFLDVMKALKEVDYHGLFNLEIPGESYGNPLEVRRLKVPYIQKVYRYLLEQ